jgi:hypothetical protein
VVPITAASRTNGAAADWRRAASSGAVSRDAVRGKGWKEPRYESNYQIRIVFI